MDLTRAVVDAKDSCQELTDSCKEFSDSCHKLTDSCQELADSYKSLQAMAADLLSSWEQFKSQQAAGTSSPSTTATTPPPTAPVPPPTTLEEAPATIESVMDRPLKICAVSELSMPVPAKCSMECQGIVSQQCEAASANLARTNTFTSKENTAVLAATSTVIARSVSLAEVDHVVLAPKLLSMCLKKSVYGEVCVSAAAIRVPPCPPDLHIQEHEGYDAIIVMVQSARVPPRPPDWRCTTPEQGASPPPSVPLSTGHKEPRFSWLRPLPTPPPDQCKLYPFLVLSGPREQTHGTVIVDGQVSIASNLIGGSHHTAVEVGPTTSKYFCSLELCVKPKVEINGVTILWLELHIYSTYVWLSFPWNPGWHTELRCNCTMHERQAPKAIYECDFLEWQVEAWTHAFLYMKYDAELVNQIGKSLKNCFCYPTSSEWIIHMRLGLTSLDLMSDGLAYPWLMVVASIFPSVISMAYPCAQMYAARPAREANDVKGLEFSIHNSEFYSLLSTRPGYHHGSPESYFADFPWIIAWSFIRGSSFGTNKRERPIHEANGINFENEGVLLFVHEYWQGMFGCLQWDPGGICKASSELGWEQAKSQTSWELPKELGYIELSWELPEELGYIELSWELPEELGYIELWQLETFLQNIQYDAKVVNQIAEEMLLCTWIKFNGNNLTGNICFGFSHFQHYGHLARFACLVHAYQLINIDRKTWDYLALVLQGRP